MTLHIFPPLSSRSLFHLFSFIFLAFISSHNKNSFSQSFLSRICFWKLAFHSISFSARVVVVIFRRETSLTSESLWKAFMLCTEGEGWEFNHFIKVQSQRFMSHEVKLFRVRAQRAVNDISSTLRGDDEFNWKVLRSTSNLSFYAFRLSIIRYIEERTISNGNNFERATGGESSLTTKPDRSGFENRNCFARNPSEKLTHLPFRPKLLNNVFLVLFLAPSKHKSKHEIDDKMLKRAECSSSIIC